MQITAPFGPGGPVRLEPRPFRGWRDGLVAGVLGAVVVGCVAAAVQWGHAAAVLGAVYGAMALLVWLEAFRSTWAISPDELVARRWALWRTLRADDVVTVDIEPGEPGVELSVGGHRLTRVVVPVDDWRDRPGAIERLGDFLANAERHGARVDPAVWRALAER